jgi:hypothetical protein
VRPKPPIAPRTTAESLVRTTLSLGDASLRADYVASVVRDADIASLARALDGVCEQAEQAEAPAREALLSVVDALNAVGMEDRVQLLREQAAGESLLALERLLRQPVRGPESAPPAAGAKGARAIAIGGRPMTLGERKSLARRPDRDTMEHLLADPHPDVIHRLLRNPRVLEDDVVRLAARRPGRADVLAEIARATKWVHRPRVRMALVMNPATPAPIAARIAGLLLRPELELVVGSPTVPAPVRAVCREHLERRPPVEATEAAEDEDRVH